MSWSCQFGLKLIYRNQKYVFRIFSLNESIKSFGSWGFKQGRPGNRKQTYFLFWPKFVRLYFYNVAVCILSDFLLVPELSENKTEEISYTVNMVIIGEGKFAIVLPKCYVGL